MDDVMFLLSDLDDSVARLNALTFAIAKDSNNPVVTEYLLGGVIDVAQWQAGLLAKLEGYGFKTLSEAQDFYRNHKR